MIRPDFAKVERLLLIYPARISEDSSDYNTLTDFYDELIALVPSDIHVIVLVKSRVIEDRIKGLRKRLEYIVHKELSTIWLRDVAGFNCGDRIVKPIFRPRYYRGAFRRAEKIDHSMELISEILGKELVRVPLVWDGGNLVTNGKIGIITARILKENPQYREAQIADMIREYLQIEPVFVPELEGDVLGHADGYVAFLDERTAVVSEYPARWHERDRQYVRTMAELLQGYGIKVVRIMDCPEGPSRGRKKRWKIQSAKEIYVNFLRLNETFMLPQFSFDEILREDDYNSLNKNILAKYGDVIPINCDQLAKFGGVLHCISFTD
jgi:agmatine/peptidylarginine deiminase